MNYQVSDITTYVNYNFSEPSLKVESTKDRDNGTRIGNRRSGR